MSKMRDAITKITFVAVLVVVAVFITGCSTVVPVTMKFPHAPEPLLEKTQPLQTVPEDTKELSVIIDNANDNYSRYHILEKKYNAWQTWYNQQRIIHQQVTEE